ncbi:MAG: hypothetical protein WCO28_01520 [Bacteroidota bacterium]|jgi:protein involved in sex pheromone biosynthesis
MKKVLTILAAASMLAVVACGPSAADKKKAEDKRIQDSIESAQRAQDSINAMMATMAPDSTKVDSAAVVATPAK